MVRNDPFTDFDANPILKDGERQQQEPRHDVENYNELGSGAIAAELSRVRTAQGLAAHQRAPNKRVAIAELSGPRYHPYLPTLRSRCKDLGLASDATLPPLRLRRSLNRRHSNDRVPLKQQWRPTDLRKLCAHRGLRADPGDTSSLLFKLLKYELEVAQDRPQRDDRCVLDWRLTHYQDPALFAPPLPPVWEAAYRSLHSHLPYGVWSEEYVGPPHPTPPRTEQEALEVELESHDHLRGFEGHQAEEWLQIRPNDWPQRRQWRGMKLLFRSFALAYFGDESRWQDVQAAAQTLWLYAIDTRHALVPGSERVNELARQRRTLYEKLDTSTRRNIWRGRLLDQLFDWRVEGTVEMVQLLADAYNVEVIVHIPHRIEVSPSASRTEWKVISRGISRTHPAESAESHRGQINLINYSSINRWAVAQHLRSRRPRTSSNLATSPTSFEYTNHLEQSRRHYTHRRPVLDDFLLPPPLQRNTNVRSEDLQPNYVLDTEDWDVRPVDLTQDRRPNFDTYFTGGTGRITTAEDYALIQRVRREALSVDEESYTSVIFPGLSADGPSHLAHQQHPLTHSQRPWGLNAAISSGPADSLPREIVPDIIDAEMGVRRLQRLTGLGQHPEIVYRQHHVRGDGRCLFRAFAQVYFGTQQAWRRVARDAERMLGRAGLFEGVPSDPAINAARRAIYSSLNRESIYYGHRSLIAQVQGRAYGTDALLQILADIYGIEIFIHRVQINPESLDAGWYFQVRGDQAPSRQHQVHLINYPNLNHWDALRPLHDARHTAHSSANVYQEALRGVGDHRGARYTIPEPLRRGPRRGRGPNYLLSATHTTVAAADGDRESDNDFAYPLLDDGDPHLRRDIFNPAHGDALDGSGDERDGDAWQTIGAEPRLPFASVEHDDGGHFHAFAAPPSSPPPPPPPPPPSSNRRRRRRRRRTDEEEEEEELKDQPLAKRLRAADSARASFSPSLPSQRNDVWPARPGPGGAGVASLDEIIYPEDFGAGGSSTPRWLRRMRSVSGSEEGTGRRMRSASEAGRAEFERRWAGWREYPVDLAAYDDDDDDDEERGEREILETPTSQTGRRRRGSVALTLGSSPPAVAGGVPLSGVPEEEEQQQQQGIPTAVQQYMHIPFGSSPPPVTTPVGGRGPMDPWALLRPSSADDPLSFRKQRSARQQSPPRTPRQPPRQLSVGSGGGGQRTVQEAQGEGGPSFEDGDDLPDYESPPAPTGPPVPATPVHVRERMSVGWQGGSGGSGGGRSGDGGRSVRGSMPAPSPRPSRSSRG